MSLPLLSDIGLNVREEPKASVLSAYKICDLAYKILKV
jgi:hypothetical protein